MLPEHPSRRPAVQCVDLDSASWLTSYSSRASPPRWKHTRRTRIREVEGRMENAISLRAPFEVVQHESHTIDFGRLIGIDVGRKANDGAVPRAAGPREPMFHPCH